MPIDRGELYKESNNMAMQYARHAIQFAFLLNGAAATALFAKAGDAYTAAACVFALGAWLAVISMGLAYVTQMLITEGWRQDSPNLHIYFWGKVRTVSPALSEIWRLAAAGCWVLSMLLAFAGVLVAYA